MGTRRLSSVHDRVHAVFHGLLQPGGDLLGVYFVALDDYLVVHREDGHGTGALV